MATLFSDWTIGANGHINLSRIIFANDSRLANFLISEIKLV